MLVSSDSRRVRAYRFEMAMIRRAPRWSTGESGAVSRMPPSPYQSEPSWIAGKMSGSAADAMMWSTVIVVTSVKRWGRCHGSTSRPSSQVTEAPVE